MLDGTTQQKPKSHPVNIEFVDIRPPDSWQREMPRAEQTGYNGAWRRQP